MNEHTGNVKSWTQQRLIPPAYEWITCEIVIDHEQGIVTYHVRRMEDECQTLTHAWTLPLRDPHDFVADFQQCLAEFKQLTEACQDPF